MNDLIKSALFNEIAHELKESVAHLRQLSQKARSDELQRIGRAIDILADNISDTIREIEADK